tara:strand:- start:98 stop:265 length:168 start_codon:yes stop_codon:yes gene_type:complete
MKNEIRNVRPDDFGDLTSQLAHVVLGAAHSLDKTSRQHRRKKQRKAKTSVLHWHI